MEKRTALLKGVGVLLLTAVLLLSATAVTANTNNITVKQTAIKASHVASVKGAVWDNDLTYENLLACQNDPTYGELGTDADDFVLSSIAFVSFVYWIGGYWNGDPGNFDWQITFYADDGSGTKPGAIIWGPVIFLAATCDQQFVEQQGATYFFSYGVVIDPPVLCYANVKYWISWQAQGAYPPQSGIAGHSLVTLHEEKFKSTYFGYPDWVDASTVFGAPYDLAYQLLPYDLPVHCDAGGPYTGTLIAPVQFNGSAYGGREPYSWVWDFGDGGTATGQYPTHSFKEPGVYTVTLTVTDAIANTSTDTALATITGPKIDIGAMTGGFGVTAVITNNGTVNATDLRWKFTLTGGLILLGKTKSGTLTSLAVRDQATIQDSLIIGFGKTFIKVEVTCAEGAFAIQTKTGIIILFYLIGIQ
jgi:chitodextrinase